MTEKPSSDAPNAPLIRSNDAGQVLGVSVVIDPTVPPNELHVYQGGLPAALIPLRGTGAP